MSDLDRFYMILSSLPGRLLSDCRARYDTPDRGVYFFFEPGEHRINGGSRCVRVGTHAVSAGSKTKLKARLSQHRGGLNGTGNHRGSIFRLIVGLALIKRMNLTDQPFAATWGVGSSAGSDVIEAERDLEERVNNYLGQMRVVWVEADDTPGPASIRRVIESNSIGLLSTVGRNVDPPSTNWLGFDCPRESVARSGLWNSQDTKLGSYDPTFLDLLEKFAAHNQP